MAYFRCYRCNSVYEDYHPPDDTCIKCYRGLVRIIEEIINEPDYQESGFSISKEEDQ
jgi:hypothetical protein